MRAKIECGLSEGWRVATLSSALGTALALVLSPWLEAVLAPAAVLFAASFQALACNKTKEIDVEREVIVKDDKAIVTVRVPKGYKAKDVLSAAPLSGEPEGVEEFVYVVDLEENPFVYWAGLLVENIEGPCSCKGFVPLTSFASSWKLESLGLGEPVEVEGGFMAVPEVEGAREYRPGDEPRLIIWKTLYKPGGPKVKELKKVTEVVGLKKGISRFAVDLGEWSENRCMKAMGDSLASYLEDLGLRREQEPVDVAVLAPGARPPRAEIYLLLNPLACIPNLPGFPALELLREELLREFLATEKRLKEKGDVRAVPWSVPPSRSL